VSLDRLKWTLPGDYISGIRGAAASNFYTRRRVSPLHVFNRLISNELKTMAHSFIKTTEIWTLAATKQTDAGDLKICPTLCHRNGTDNADILCIIRT